MIDPQVAILTVIVLILLFAVPLIIGILAEIRFPLYHGDDLLKAVQSAYKVGIIALFVLVDILFVLAVTCAIIYTAIYAILHGGL